MGKGKEPAKMGSDGGATAAPAPRPSSGGAAAEAAEGPKPAPVANRECIDCDNCGVANPQIRCSGCLCKYYCSKECQLENWEDHKKLCAGLKDARDLYNAARDGNNVPSGMPAVIDGTCAICLEEQVKHPVIFDCGHTFCFECIVAYQCEGGRSVSCPNCRGEIPNVFKQAKGRYNRFLRLARSTQEGSDERKKYCHLAMAEYDALSQLGKHPDTYLYDKAKIMSLSKDQEGLLKVTDKFLSVIQSQSGVLEFHLGHERVARTKLWRAQAYSEIGKWTDASEIYSELREEVQLSDSPGNEFQLEMGHCRCLFELGDYNKAIKCGTRAVSIYRSCAGAHAYLALAQKEAGNIDAAKKIMSRAILHETPWNAENLERNKQILRDL